MGFFSKIFKSVKKVFTGIGKGIKKAFTAVGKFTNKLGIVGQIGMMFVAPAIAGWAMKGLTTLGSGFMTGGFMTGLNTAAQGTGFLSGVAKVTHGIFSTVANVASSGMKIFNNITGAVSNVFKGITNGLKNVFNIPVDAGVGEVLNSASNALSGRPVTVDPYAVAGEVAIPDPYDTFGKGISLDDVFDSSEGLIGASTTFRDIPANVEIKALGPDTISKPVYEGTPLTEAQAAEEASADSEPGIWRTAFGDVTKNLVQRSVNSLMTPSYVEPPPYVDRSRYVPDKTSLHAMSQAENTARGYGAPLDTLSSSVIGGDWNTMVASTQEFNTPMNAAVYRLFLQQSQGPQPYQSPLVS